MMFCILAATSTRDTQCRRKGCGQRVILPPGCNHDQIKIVCAGNGGLGTRIGRMLQRIGIRKKSGCGCFQKSNKLDQLFPWV